MQAGFNTNVRHRGVVFHVQTEDSGMSHPHVTTLLFHRGNIMASEKTSYADDLGSPDVAARVRRVMVSQHKEMLRGLCAGLHDEAIVLRGGPGMFADGADAEPGDAAATVPPEAPARADEGSRAATPTEHPQRAGGFGSAVVSEKPLGQVVLDSLVENAHARKQRAK